MRTHLNLVLGQLTCIRDNAPEPSVDGAAGDSMVELQHMVSFLRKNREIADLQLDINKQEISQYRADIQRLEREADEAKALCAKVYLILPLVRPALMQSWTSGTRSSKLAGAKRRSERTLFVHRADQPAARVQRGAAGQIRERIPAHCHSGAATTDCRGTALRLWPYRKEDAQSVRQP